MGFALLLVGFACTGIINEFSYSKNPKSKEAQHWKTTKENSIRCDILSVLSEAKILIDYQSGSSYY